MYTEPVIGIRPTEGGPMWSWHVDGHWSTTLSDPEGRVWALLRAVPGPKMISVRHDGPSTTYKVVRSPKWKWTASLLYGPIMGTEGEGDELEVAMKAAETALTALLLSSLTAG